MAATDQSDDGLRKEVGELRRIVREQREELEAIKEQRTEGIVEALGLDTPTGRRQALKYAGASAVGPALLAYALSNTSQADAVAADVGTQADPWQKVWTHAIEAGDGASALSLDGDLDDGSTTVFDQSVPAWVAQLGASGSPTELHATSISSATTTDGEAIIDADVSSAGFTLTLASADATLGHGKWIRLRGANTLTIDTEGAENIDGGGSITITQDDGFVFVYSDGTNWFTSRNLDLVNLLVGTIHNGGSAISVGDSLVPDSDDSLDLGTAANSFRDLFYAQALKDAGGDVVLGQSVFSGSVTLSSGAATIDTGVGVGNTATFFVALGPDTVDAEIAASIEAPTGGNYTVHLDEVNTSVGNPSVFADVVRVR